MTTVQGALVLIPVSLGETPWQHFLPNQAQGIAAGIRHFIVENPKAARTQLKRLEHPTPLRDLSILPLPDKGSSAELDQLLTPALDGHDVGLMSDAGCPAVADPGARLVARAHALGLRVRPLVGPSSILLALMASGLNGQSFAFCGYLPVPADERDTHIRRIEEESRRMGRTQIFIETPYRNERMLDALLSVCNPATQLCVAMDVTTEHEWIRTQEISRWRKGVRPDLARRPALFLILA